MRNTIAIKSEDKIFKYLTEYIIDPYNISHTNAKWYKNGNDIWLFNYDNQYDESEYYKYNNDINNVNEIVDYSSDYIPDKFDCNTLKLYIPTYCVDVYDKNITYILSFNTWIGSHKINLGTKLFKRSDLFCNKNGMIKHNGSEFYESIEIKLADPFDIMYSDNWKEFRKNVCNEPENTNNTGSILYVTLDVLSESYEGNYILNENYICGSTHFNISLEDIEFLKLNLNFDIENRGWLLSLNMNKSYDNNLLEYLNETYGLENISNENVFYEIVLKNKDSLIIGPKKNYFSNNQLITFSDIINCKDERLGMKDFFSSWESYEEGWKIIGALIVENKELNEEILNILSNEIPITQEIFKFFIGDSCKKIIDTSNMEIKNYTVVNKIINNVVQIERPLDSKSNIIQPVFFRVKDTEYLTIHPIVTENVCINLDDYKSKVKNFMIQIEGCIFKQIGSNKHGEIFKITANTLPCEKTDGIYYVLDENAEYITSGKYKYIM